MELVDTGGMGGTDVDNLTAHIEEQIQTAIDSADAITTPLIESGSFA